MEESEEENIEIAGASATEVVAMWGGTVIQVKHFPHTGTFGSESHITTRGETAVAGACMVAGGVVLGRVAWCCGGVAWCGGGWRVVEAGGVVLRRVAWC